MKEQSKLNIKWDNVKPLKKKEIDRLAVTLSKIVSLDKIKK